MLTCRVAQGTRLFIWCALALILNAVTANAQTSSLPAPWNAQDIGSPPIAGSVTVDQDVFTVVAAGKDIASRSDQFYFVYQQVSGDVDVIARVDSVSAVQSGSKAGVMIRSSLAANAVHGYASVSAGRGIAFQTRTSAGGNTSSTSGGSAGPPRWVRILRTGSTLTAYTSTDGKAWTTISSRTVPLGATAYVGLATTSRSTSAATTAALSQVAVVPLALPSPQKGVDIGAPA